MAIKPFVVVVVVVLVVANLEYSVKALDSGSGRPRGGPASSSSGGDRGTRTGLAASSSDTRPRGGSLQDDRTGRVTGSARSGGTPSGTLNTGSRSSSPAGRDRAEPSVGGTRSSGTRTNSGLGAGTAPSSGRRGVDRSSFVNPATSNNDADADGDTSDDLTQGQPLNTPVRTLSSAAPTDPSGGQTRTSKTGGTDNLQDGRGTDSLRGGSSQRGTARLGSTGSETRSGSSNGAGVQTARAGNGSSSRTSGRNPSPNGRLIN